MVATKTNSAGTMSSFKGAIACPLFRSKGYLSAISIVTTRLRSAYHRPPVLLSVATFVRRRTLAYHRVLCSVNDTSSKAYKVSSAVTTSISLFARAGKSFLQLPADGSLWMLEDANPGALIHVTPD